MAAMGAGLALMAPGCGSDNASDAPAASTKAAATPASAAPKELLGTYETTLRTTDYPENAAPELTASKRWKLTIAPSGGIDDGSVFAIGGDEGNLESPSFIVKGDHVVLRREECAAGGDSNFYDNEYGYVLEGDTLRFTTVRNQCPDKVAETILTSRAWKRTS
jgi:hypothetical protein